MVFSVGRILGGNHQPMEGTHRLSATLYYGQGNALFSVFMSDARNSTHDVMPSNFLCRSQYHQSC